MNGRLLGVHFSISCFQNLMKDFASFQACSGLFCFVSYHPILFQSPFLEISLVSLMAWPNLFRRNDQNTRSICGYTFQWTPEHLTEEQMHPMKFSYDVLAADCLNRLDKISPPPTSGELPRNQSRAPNTKEGDDEQPKSDLYALLRDNSSEDEKLGELWREVNTTPDWVVSGLVTFILATLLIQYLGLGSNRERSGSILKIWGSCTDWDPLPTLRDVMQISI